jgi:hypothetical protein
MTEPDLVDLGSDVSLDDCSVVAHINSRGMFALNRLQIGNGYVIFSFTVRMHTDVLAYVVVLYALVLDCCLERPWKKTVCYLNTLYWLPARSRRQERCTSGGLLTAWHRKQSANLPQRPLTYIEGAV